MRLALAGDTMLGREVGKAVATAPVTRLFSEEVVAAANEADLFVLNLECCISPRGERWPDPRKPFFFRAPPAAVDALQLLGVNCVTLANNHALDYGHTALQDTIDIVRAAGIAVVGAGADRAAARQPAVVEHAGFTLGVLAISDHPREYAATDSEAGIAYADLHRGGVPPWLVDHLASLSVDASLVTPHWGPNMTTSPPAHVRRSADTLLAAGATLVAGHSAHVFHGVARRILYDMGDFIDDYAVDPGLRNDLGLLWFVDLDGERVAGMEALPLQLGFCRTSVASGDDAAWIRRRLGQACEEFGTEVSEHDGRLVLATA